MPPDRVIVLSLPGFDPPTTHDTSEAAPPDFAPIFARLTGVVPEIEVIRPGLVVMRARGPARYYGGEPGAAEALITATHELGVSDARVGIADGRFAAIIAAHLAEDSSTSIIPAEASAEFLRDLPVSHLGVSRLEQVLPGLGIYTLGAFAALPEDAVRARFGPSGVHAHRHARGMDPELRETVRPDLPEQDFEVGLDFETPISGAEELAFACGSLTERLSASLANAGMVCTTLRVTLTDDAGARHEREWAHPRFFTPADMLARLRWQAGAFEPGTPQAAPAEHTGAGIEAVRLFPTRTDRAATHEPGLWVTGVDDRVHHHVSRAQSLLGPAGVGTATIDGGRLLRDRQRFTPWGVAPNSGLGPGQWPGALPRPVPSLVFDPPFRAMLYDSAGSTVSIDPDDLLSAAPASLQVEQHQPLSPVRGWSRPWPIREHWWEGRPSRFRLQLELEGGDAWVILAQLSHKASPNEPVRWFAEGRYD